MYQEAADSERSTEPSHNNSRQGRFFTIKREGINKVRVVGCGFFKETTGLAVFTVSVNVITVRIVQFVAGMFK